MIKPVVAHLAAKFKENKSVQAFFSDFTAAAVQWLRPIFLIDDDKPQKAIAGLIKDPTDKDYINAVESDIKIAVKENPDLAAQLQTLYDELQTKAPITQNTLTVTGDDNKTYQGIINSQISDNSINNSKNVNAGTINAGGKVTIGDHKTDQTHSGSGDNVGGDKVINNS